MFCMPWNRGLSVPSVDCSCLALQELKSQQPELAARVAEQLVAAGWVAAGGGTLLPEAVGSGRTAAADVTAAGGGAGSDGGSVQGHAPRHEHFAAAGLTITSFHLQQLMRSRKASMVLEGSAKPCACAHFRTCGFGHDHYLVFSSIRIAARCCQGWYTAG